MSDEQEQAALLLERVRDRLSGKEMEHLESIIEAAGDEEESDEDLEELEEAVNEAQEALDSAQDDLDEAEKALAEYKRYKQERPDMDEALSTLTRLCTEYAEEFK